MSRLTIQPYRLNLDGSVSATGTAASAIDPQATDVLNEAGHGEVTFKNADPLLDVLQMDGRDILQFRIDNTPVFAFMPDPAEITTISQNERAGELTKLSGPGLLGGILSRRLIYPTGGIDPTTFKGKRPRERDRFANWTHPDFNFAAVADGDSKELITVGDAKVSWPDPWADDFPYDLAQIIFDKAAGTSTYLDSTVQHCWFWYDQPIAEDGLYRLFWATDNRGEAYCQGQQVGTSDTFKATSQVDIEITAGTARFAWHVDNSSVFGGPSGPGGLAWALYEVTLAGLTLVGYSFSGVQVLADVDDPPGVTPGQAWIWLDDEAETRGGEPIGRTFGAVNDSNSVAWPEVADIATSVKATMLEWQGQLAGTYADFRFDPDLSAGLSLGMYRLGEMGSSSGVTLTRAVNITSLEHQRENMPITAVLIDGADDWYERTDTGSITVYGRVEAGLDIGAPASSAEIFRIADAQLDVFAQPREEIDAGIRPRAGEIPGVDFVVGDGVTVPDSTGVSQEERCVAITWTTIKGTDQAVFTCVFRDVIVGEQERIIRMAAR